MFKLALNAGHGKNTAGKRCLKSIDPSQTREYTLNKRICDKIENNLALYDNVKILRIDDGSEISIKNRALKANKWGADFYLAIHHNAGINGGNGGGIEAYTYLKVSSETEKWQKALYERIIKKTSLKGNRAQPLRKANLGECRLTNMPAVLLECGYMDSVTDTPIILTEEFADKVAAACSEVIVQLGNLTLKTSQSVKKSNAELAEEVIAGKWGNGAERKEKLTKAGYNYSEIQGLVNKILRGVKK